MGHAFLKGSKLWKTDFFHFFLQNSSHSQEISFEIFVWVGTFWAIRDWNFDGTFKKIEKIGLAVSLLKEILSDPCFDNWFRNRKDPGYEKRK